jgi:hypothetical protein
VDDRIRFYMDEHVPSAVTKGLRRRGFDVLTAQEAGLISVPDPVQLEHATGEGRVLVTQDDDFLRLDGEGVHHAGIAYAHQRTPTGRILSGLVLVYQVLSPEDMVDWVEYL